MQKNYENKDKYKPVCVKYINSRIIWKAITYMNETIFHIDEHKYILSQNISLKQAKKCFKLWIDDQVHR